MEHPRPKVKLPRPCRNGVSGPARYWRMGRFVCRQRDAAHSLPKP